MKLGRTSVLEGRIESLPADLKGSFDAAVMRCAGGIEEMIPAAAALVADSGIVVASGPPKARPLSIGEWVTVPGLTRGSSRRFATYTKTDGGARRA
jgi:hypothetical protein